MSDTETDSEVQFNIRPYRNNVIRDESVDEESNYDTQNEQDYEQPHEQPTIRNADKDVTSPRGQVSNTTSQSEPLVPNPPRSQGSTMSVDTPSRRSSALRPSVDDPDQHSHAVPRVDNPGRQPMHRHVDNPGRHSTDQTVDSPGRRSLALSVDDPDQHSKAVPRVDNPGRQPMYRRVDNPGRYSIDQTIDSPGRRSPTFGVDDQDQHFNATPTRVGNLCRHSRFQQVDNPGRRNNSPDFRDNRLEQRPHFRNLDRRSRTLHATEYDRDHSRRSDVPGRRRRSPGYTVSFQDRNHPSSDITRRNLDRNTGGSRYHKTDTVRDSRAENLLGHGNLPNFGAFLENENMRGISVPSRQTYSPDRGRYDTYKRTRSPSPHFYRPIRRSRPQTRESRERRKRYYSPYGRRQRSFDYERRSRSPGWGDINQSNRKSMRIPSGRPEYRDSSSHRSCPDLEPYINDPYDSEFDYERKRNGTEYEDEHVHYSSCQGGPRIKPESYSGTEDWEEYQSHFEDCAELSRWDHRSKVLFLAASLKGQARTYYMSLDAHDKRSYTALIYKMKQRFGSSQHAIKWLNQLESRQRKSGESITALGDELRQLAKKAYRHLDSNAQETLALNQLYKLIPVEMKCRCIDHDCQSIHEAVDVIERYEAILGEASVERKKSSLRNIDHVTENKNDDPSIPGILKKLDARLEKLETLSFVQQIAGRENTPKQQRKPAPVNRNNRCCFFCASPDHMVRDCPEKARQGSKQRYPGPTNSAFQAQHAGAWQAPQQQPRQPFPSQNTSQALVPLPLPPFNYPPPNYPENAQLSTQ